MPAAKRKAPATDSNAAPKRKAPSRGTTTNKKSAETTTVKPKKPAKKSAKKPVKKSSTSTKPKRAAAISLPEKMSWPKDIFFGGFIEFWTPADAAKKSQKAPSDDDEDDEELQPISQVYRKAAKDYTGSGALISNTGYERLCDMYNATVERSPEANGIIHIYEDYLGYGEIEVVEMQMAAYDKEVKKKNPDSMNLYPIAEALAMYFMGDDMEWMNVDDGDRVAALVRLAGCLFLDTLWRLVETDERDLKNSPLPPIISSESPFENLGLVMGTMCGLADRWIEVCGEKDATTMWKDEIVELAKGKGIEMKQCRVEVSKYDDREIAGEECREDDEGECEKEKEKPKYEWAEELKRYKKQYKSRGFGMPEMSLAGLTKKEKAELNRNANLDMDA